MIKTKTVSLGILSAVLLGAFAVVGGARAVSTLPDPGLLPTSPFYFFDRLGEKLGDLFVRNPEKKAERALEHAQERLSELDALSKKQNVASKVVSNTLGDFESETDHAVQNLEDAQSNGQNVGDLATKVNQEIAKHRTVLLQILSQAPDAATPGLENALNTSLKGSERVLQVLPEAQKREAERELEQNKTEVEHATQNLSPSSSPSPEEQDLENELQNIEKDLNSTESQGSSELNNIEQQ